MVKKVYLSVRFPCSLLFQLKSCTPIPYPESLLNEGRQVYELQDGQCQPNEKLVTEYELIHKNGRYLDRRVLFEYIEDKPGGNDELRQRQDPRWFGGPQNS